MPTNESLDAAYAELGVQKTDTMAAIKKAYTKLILKWHPDKCSKPEDSEQKRLACTEKFKKINDAYKQIGLAGKN